MERLTMDKHLALSKRSLSGAVAFSERSMVTPSS